MTALQMNGSVKKYPNECDVVGNTAITEPEDYLPSIEYIHTSYHSNFHFFIPYYVPSQL